MTRHFRLSLLLALIVLTLSVSWMGLQVHQNVTRLIALSRRVARTRDRMDRLHETILMLTTIETCQRGMLLTRKDDYLESYEMSIDRLSVLMASLAKDVSQDKLADVRDLTKMVNEKLAEISRTLELNESGDHASAVALVATDRGEFLKKEILKIINQLNFFELRGLHALREEAADSANGSLSWLMARLLMTVLMAVGLYAMITAEIRRRRRVEVVLSESEERFRSGFEAAAIGMALVAPSGRFLKVNLALCESVGYSAAELLEKDTQSITVPEDLGADSTQMKRLLAGQIHSYQMQKRYIHKFGQMVNVVIGVALVRDKANRPVQLVATIEDITSRVKAEQALRESERRFHAIFDQTFQLMGLLDRDGNVLEVNRTALDFSGVSRADVVGRPIWEEPWWHGLPEGRERLKIAIARAAQGEMDRFETCHPAADGTVATIDFSIKPVFDDAGKVVLLIPEGRDISERKRAEQALSESEQRFRGGFEAAAIGMALIAPGGRFLQVNRALCECLGYREDELLAIEFQSITHPDDLAANLDQVHQLLAGKTESFQIEKRYLHKNGRVIHAVVGVSVVRDESNRPLYLVGQIEDITARKLAEEQANELRFIASVADALPLPLHLFDLVERRTLWANARNAALFGLVVEDLTSIAGLAVEERLHPEDSSELDKHLAQIAVAADGEICEVEYRIRHGDGKWHWIRRRDVVFHRDPDGRARQVLGMDEDVNERHCAVAELAHVRAQLVDAIESLDSGLVIYDANECLVICNRRYREMYTAAADLITPGITYEEWLRAYYVRSTGPVKALSLEEFVAHRLESHRTIRGVRELKHGDRWLRAGDFTTAAGGVVSIRTDITEMKQTEDDLRSARDAARDAERAKAAFLANMSHEIRTPMNGVLGMAELVLGTALTTPQREYIATIKSSADALLTIINDILDFSKIEAGKLSLDKAPFGLHTCIDETLRMFAPRAHEKGLELKAHIDPDTPDLLIGDSHRLRQVLMNLIGNAIKFTDHGEVSVKVELKSDGESGDVLAFSILDTGIGVPEDRREAIFEPFEQADSSTTRKYGGTGLGLAISAKLVELMDGSIKVEGRPEGGSCFRFTAKFTRSEAGEFPPVAPPDWQASPDSMTYDSNRAAVSLRILLAEDNQVNQIVAIHMLERFGHHATVVGDGRAALDALESKRFDLVLMDVQMPEMDGFEAVAEIRRREAGHPAEHIPVVALTAHAMAGDRDRCLNAGFDAYLSKPIRLAELAQTLTELANTLPIRGPLIFDPTTLAELCAGDTEIITDVLETFLKETPAAIERIAQALEAGDLIALSRAAHALKGGCQTTGADALAITCRLLEKQASHDESVSIRRERIDREWLVLAKAIESYLKLSQTVGSRK